MPYVPAGFTWEEQRVLPGPNPLLEVLLDDGQMCGGMDTSRYPASDFDGPTTGPPGGKVTARRTLICRLATSMSFLRSSANSPYRNAHQAAIWIAARSRGGMFTAMTSISAGAAGSTGRYVAAAPAPRIWTGDARMSFSSTAVFMIARRSP